MFFEATPKMYLKNRKFASSATSQTRDEVEEYLENKYIDDWESSLVRYSDDNEIEEVIWFGHHVEPEDASLNRSFSWVVEAMNKLAEELA